jgi:hypothetical protein
VENVAAVESEARRRLLATRDDIHQLELKIERSKVDVYKAMFLSGVLQLLAILSGVLAIVKWMK